MRKNSGCNQALEITQRLERTGPQKKRKEKDCKDMKSWKAHQTIICELLGVFFYLIFSFFGVFVIVLINKASIILTL